MTEAEKTIAAYGLLLAKAVRIVREGKYGGYEEPSEDMDDGPLLAVREGQAELSWTEDYYDTPGARRETAKFPLHLLDSTDEDLTKHFAQIKQARIDAEAERKRQEDIRRNANRRDLYEALKKEFEG